MSGLWRLVTSVSGKFGPSRKAFGRACRFRLHYRIAGKAEARLRCKKSTSRLVSNRAKGDVRLKTLECVANSSDRLLRQLLYLAVFIDSFG